MLAYDKPTAQFCGRAEVSMLPVFVALGALYGAALSQEVSTGTRGRRAPPWPGHGYAHIQIPDPIGCARSAVVTFVNVSDRPIKIHGVEMGYLAGLRAVVHDHMQVLHRGCFRQHPGAGSITIEPGDDHHVWVDVWELIKGLPVGIHDVDFVLAVRRPNGELMELDLGRHRLAVERGVGHVLRSHADGQVKFWLGTTELVDGMPIQVWLGCWVHATFRVRTSASGVVMACYEHESFSRLRPPVVRPLPATVDIRIIA